MKQGVRSNRYVANLLWWGSALIFMGCWPSHAVCSAFNERTTEQVCSARCACTQTQTAEDRHTLESHTLTGSPPVPASGASLAANTSARPVAGSVSNTGSCCTKIVVFRLHCLLQWPECVRLAMRDSMHMTAWTAMQRLHLAGCRSTRLQTLHTSAHADAARACTHECSPTGKYFSVVGKCSHRGKCRTCNHCGLPACRSVPCQTSWWKPCAAWCTRWQPTHSRRWRMHCALLCHFRRSAKRRMHLPQRGSVNDKLREYFLIRKAVSQACASGTAKQLMLHVLVCVHPNSMECTNQPASSCRNLRATEQAAAEQALWELPAAFQCCSNLLDACNQLQLQFTDH